MDYDGVVSLAEFAKVASLRLHLIAQGVAEKREAGLVDLPEARRTKRSFLARMAVDRALKGLQSASQSMRKVMTRRSPTSRVSDLASALSASKAKHGSASDLKQGASVYRWRNSLRNVSDAAEGAEAERGNTSISQDTSAACSTHATPERPEGGGG